MLVKTSLSGNHRNHGTKVRNLLVQSIGKLRGEAGLKNFWVDQNELSFIAGRTRKWCSHLGKTFCSFVYS